MEFEKLYDFQNLYNAHRAARLGKRNKKEVIDFEMNLSQNLVQMFESIRNHTYQMQSYYQFMVHDPKERVIHALHYPDRVVQHCLCDQIVGPILDRHLIYDNAACRIGKGTHFALDRVSGFLRSYVKAYGNQGYFLKCDIRKYFYNIDHAILKRKLRKVIGDLDVLQFLDAIIDGFETDPGKGLPLGNQTSQWFALYYLDELDRLVKEQLQVPYYSRYMDDCVLIHHDKAYLRECLRQMTACVQNNLHLEFNEKTQIQPLKNGIDYLGFHFYVTDTHGNSIYF